MHVHADLIQFLFQPTCLEMTVTAAMVENARIVALFVNHLADGTTAEKSLSCCKPLLVRSAMLGRIRRRLCVWQPVLTSFPGNESLLSHATQCCIPVQAPQRDRSRPTRHNQV